MICSEACSPSHVSACLLVCLCTQCWGHEDIFRTFLSLSVSWNDQNNKITIKIICSGVRWTKHSLAFCGIPQPHIRIWTQTNADRRKNVPKKMGRKWVKCSIGNDVMQQMDFLESIGSFGRTKKNKANKRENEKQAKATKKMSEMGRRERKSFLRCHLCSSSVCYHEKITCGFMAYTLAYAHHFLWALCHFLTTLRVCFRE